jgi:hypothetical protein
MYPSFRAELHFLHYGWNVKLPSNVECDYCFASRRPGRSPVLYRLFPWTSMLK